MIDKGAYGYAALNKVLKNSYKKNGGPMNLIYNVKIYTMDKSFSVADAMVWKKGRIVAIGKKGKLVADYRCEKLTDGNKATILPGFIDPHIHFFDGAMLQGTIDLTPENVPDIKTMKQKFAELAKTTPNERWIGGQGYDPLSLLEKRSPDRYDLDEACPDQPAAAFHYSVHECVVNSKALELLSIDKNTPQPYAGEIVKDKNGIPTGRLVEMAEGEALAQLRESLINFSEEEIMSRIQEVQQLLFSYGITRIGDPAVTTSMKDLYERAQQNNVLKMPVTLYPCDDDNLLALPVSKAEIPFEQTENETIINGPLKVFLDGADRAAMRLTITQVLKSLWSSIKISVKKSSLEPIKLMLRSPFVLKGGFNVHFGVLMVPRDKGLKCVSKAIKNGYPVAFHAIGNEAIEQAADIIGSICVKHKQTPPPRIEHGTFLTDHCIQKIKDQKMAIVTQPEFLSVLGSRNAPPLPGFRIIPLRTLINEGIRVAGSSDWPVVSCNPLEGIERAVTRKTDENEVLQVDEAISVKEAIAMYTGEAAYVLGQTSDVGTLEAGRRADFILLSEDPYTVESSRLSAIKVRKTFLGGELVYEC